MSRFNRAVCNRIIDLRVRSNRALPVHQLGSARRPSSLYRAACIGLGRATRTQCEQHKVLRTAIRSPWPALRNDASSVTTFLGTSAATRGGHRWGALRSAPQPRTRPGSARCRQTRHADQARTPRLKRCRPAWNADEDLQRATVRWRGSRRTYGVTVTTELETDVLQAVVDSLQQLLNGLRRAQRSAAPHRFEAALPEPAPSTTAPSPLLLTVPQAAAKLGVSRSMFYELLNRGDLQSVSIGRARRVALAELERYVGHLE